jgi:hypothetical protein
MRIERVNPANFAKEASNILTAAWSPPCVNYSAEYLHWQFTFPGPPSIGVLARDERSAVGFGAMMPRRLRFRDGPPHYAYYLSFVAVVPAVRGRGLAIEMYSVLLGVAAAEGLPIVAFTPSESAGERTLRRAVANAGFLYTSLGEQPIYGSLPQAEKATGSAAIESSLRVETLMGVIETHGETDTLWSCPDIEISQHWEKHPWPYRVLVVRGPAGTPAGAAIALAAETLTEQGITHATTLHKLYLPKPSADELGALIRGAAAEVSLPGSSPIVLLPNPTPVQPDVLRQAGFRQTPTRFSCHLAVKAGNHPFLKAQSTNISIE